MATYTIFASATNFGTIESFDPTIAPVRAGTGYTSGAINVKTDASYNFGFWLDAWYLAYQHFWEFDTSSIIGTIQSATISVFQSAANTGSNVDGVTHYAKLFDFGASLTTADWRTPTQFNALTNMGHMTWPTLATGVYTDFTSDTGMISNINRSGPTRMVCCTDLYAVGGTPTGLYGQFIYTSAQTGTTNDPKLVVVTTAVGASAMTEGADTLAAAATHPVLGASAMTEGADTLAAAATHPVLGASAMTEGADIVAGAAKATVGATAGMTEGSDIATAMGTELVIAAASITEGADVLAAAGTLVPLPPHAQWDPVVKNVWVVLSNGARTAHGTIPAGNNSTGIGDTTTTAIGAGAKRYWEMHYDAGGSNGLGVATTALSIYDGAYLGIDGAGLAYYDTGGIYSSNNLLMNLAPYAAGDVISTAVVGGTAVWFRVNGGNWNNNPAANPVTGVGGIAVPAGTIYPAYNVKDGEQWTANFSPVLVYAKPFGFTNFDELPFVFADASITEGADRVTSAGRVFWRRGGFGRPPTYPGLFADFSPRPDPRASPPPLAGASPPPLKEAEPQVNARARPKLNPDAWPRLDPYMHAGRVLRHEYRKKKQREDDDDAAFLLL